MGYIFLSHSTNDDAIAYELQRALSDRGHDIRSRLLPGGDLLSPEIERAIENAKAYMVLVSPSSLQSSWVGRELRQGLALQKQRSSDAFPVILLSLDGTKLGVLEGYFDETPLYIALSSAPGGIEAALDKILVALRKRTTPRQMTDYPLDASSYSPSLRVFLCHSSDDKPAARELYSRLKAHRIDPWLDEEDPLPGQDWEMEIPKAVRNSDVVIVIVCLSRRSVAKTGYVQREIKYALDVADEQPEGAIFIIPLRLEECDVPARLQRWHWVNLFEKRGYEKLLRALQARATQKTIIASTSLSKEQKAALATTVRSPSASKRTRTIGVPQVNVTQELLEAMFASLSEHYGIQNWWSRDDKFQLCIEAILGQGTGWKNVGLAINNLKARNALTPNAIHTMPESELSDVIKPCGRAPSKASYIKNFVNFLNQEYELDVNKMLLEETTSLKRKLSEIRGIGNFTCDNIFVICC